MLIENWLEQLNRLLGDEPIVVSDLRIGVFYTAAQLSDGHVGVAFTPRDLSDRVCCPRSAAAAPAAGRLARRESWSVARYALEPDPVRRAVGVAVLNALSALAMSRYGTPGGRVIPAADALQVAQIRPQDRVAMVGAFPPFIKALKDRVADLWVVDKHQESLQRDDLDLWRAPSIGTEIVAHASVVLITGSALVEGGIDSLLAAANGARRIILTGPTASPWPPPFFAEGVHVLAGIRVLDGPRMLQIVSEGGSGYFFDGAAEKVCVVRETD